MVRARSSGESGNCIAGVIRAHLAQENVPPMAALGRGDGELEGGFARSAAEDRGTGKETPAQGGQLGALRLTEPALQADAEVVGADGEVAGRFGRQNERQHRPFKPNWEPSSLIRFSMSARPL